MGLPSAAGAGAAALGSCAGGQAKVKGHGDGKETS